MKKTLLSMLLLTISISVLFAGQTKEWNFGNDATTFPVSTGIGTGPFPVYVNWLGITGISSNANMGAVNASAKTINGVAYTNRFQFNGGGYPSAAAGQTTPSVNGTNYYIPTQRFLSFDVDGNSDITIHAVTGSNGNERIIFVTDGTALVGSVVCTSDNAGVVGTVQYRGTAKKLYVFCNASCNLYYMSATNVLQPVTSVKETFTSKGIIISKSEIQNINKVELEVYNIAGKKVASSKENISLTDYSKGVYIVRIAGTGETQKFTI